MKRMTPVERREAIVVAALAVAVRKGLASTTVRDVATEMGTSSGLIHHYFESMDDVLAAAFEFVARQDLGLSARSMAEAESPVRALREFFQTYALDDREGRRHPVLVRDNGVRDFVGEVLAPVVSGKK